MPSQKSDDTSHTSGTRSNKSLSPTKLAALSNRAEPILYVSLLDPHSITTQTVPPTLQDLVEKMAEIGDGIGVVATPFKVFAFNTPA